jgi:transposase InsO family protein
MTESIKNALTAKWLLVVQEYELVKQKRSKNFKTVKQICDAYRVHRKDIRKYYERWIKSGKNNDALLPQKRGPKPGQLKILTKDEERTIIKIHRRLQANRFEIYHLIKGNENFKVHPSVSTIYRTFKRYPLNKKRKEKIKRYERIYPGELLHGDTYSLPKTFFIERTKHYLFGLLDDCTRLCYAEVINNLQSPTVTKAFFNAYKWFAVHGIKVEQAMTDNGSEFTAYTSQKAKQTHFFETMLKIFDIKHRYTLPYRPQVNGKIERFWKILYNECIRVQTVSLSKNDFIAELNGFMYSYNYQRRHSSLNYQTPLDKLKQVANLLPKF